MAQRINRTAVMLVLLMMFGLLGCSTAAFSLQVPGGFIQAKVGSSVLLPCEMSPALNAESYKVSWYRPNKEDSPVLLYKDLKVQENTGDPQYRGRVSLVGDLQKGNISLKLENLTVADRGEYVCFVQSGTWYERASVNLDITGKILTYSSC
ncbi:butyrophilin subfamily 1 member A1-like isoform X1 [Astyanax mexicanus]|uniref:Butyrophilin subfamily 1 member A1-like isoform X1 n=1 Tax=Astyanax mexicanus TaxID=7994 RepID=A0A8T2KJY5_ASTMX|nr:butyrophilin subfamily 1 member A1-like isoform X1 [Astyanax mexicanus]